LLLLEGYVDVGDSVEPVITRDELQKTPSRQELYDGTLFGDSRIVSFSQFALYLFLCVVDFFPCSYYLALLNMENDIKSSLDVIIDKQRVEGLEKLENILGGVLTTIEKEDRKEKRRLQREERMKIKFAINMTAADSTTSPTTRKNNDGDKNGTETVARQLDDEVASSSSTSIEPQNVDTPISADDDTLSSPTPPTTHDSLSQVRTENEQQSPKTTDTNNLEQINAQNAGEPASTAQSSSEETAVPQDSKVGGKPGLS
jgi:hypothetical protein